MTPDERFRIINIKVERAKEHIRDLQAEISSFFMTNPYVVGTKRNPETGQLIYYLISVRETPIRLSAITGDALQNLRSALDHLAHHLILVGGGKPDRQSSFPITNTTSATKYKSNRTRKVKGMRPDAIKAIDALKPYKGGNDTLWRLSELNNIDKHRLLITVGSHYDSVNVGRMMSVAMGKQWADAGFGRADSVPIIDLFLIPGDRLFPLKAGDELFLTPPDTEVDKNVQFRFEIAFGEPQVFEGESVLETLQGMSDLVSNIITDFKPLLI